MQLDQKSDLWLQKCGVQRNITTAIFITSPMCGRGLRLHVLVTPFYGHPADRAWCSHHSHPNYPVIHFNPIQSKLSKLLSDPNYFLPIQLATAIPCFLSFYVHRLLQFTLLWQRLVYLIRKYIYLYTAAPPQAEFSAAALFYPLTGSAGLESCRLSQRDGLFRDLIRRNELIQAAGHNRTKDRALVVLISPSPRFHGAK